MSVNWRSRLLGSWTRPEDPARPITFSAELSSFHPHIAFEATFQFCWQGNDQTAFWTARKEITELADEVSSRYCVTQAGNAENEINSRISTDVPIQGRTGDHHRVALAVSPQARAAAEAILEIDRQTALERLQQRAELDRIRYLRESVYSRPDVARSYWLYHHPGQLNEMLDIDFEAIAEKFGDAEESRFLVISKLIGDFLKRLDDRERRYLLRQLGQLFYLYERPELAEELETI